MLTKAIMFAMVGILALPLALGVSSPAIAASKPKVYTNCTAMNKDYKHGVGMKGAKDKHSASSKAVTNFKVNDALYKANVKRDGDKDKIACEKH